MRNLFGYHIFVSYNRCAYIIDDIDLGSKTLREFIRFYDSDKNKEINCMTVEVTPMYDDSALLSGLSGEGDDSMYWIAPMHLVENYTEVRDFINKFINVEN